MRRVEVSVHNDAKGREQVLGTPLISILFQYMVVGVTCVVPASNTVPVFQPLYDHLLKTIVFFP